MEYVFGNECINGVICEVLKVRSEDPVSMEGYYTIERRYDDAVYTDSFRIKKRIRAKMSGGLYYAWYAIADHIRYIDRFTPGIVKTEQEITEQELAIMEAEQSLTDMDLRLMELEEKEV